MIPALEAALAAGAILRAEGDRLGLRSALRRLADYFISELPRRPLI